MKFGTIIKILLSVYKYGMILLDDIDTYVQWKKKCMSKLIYTTLPHY